MLLLWYYYISIYIFSIYMWLLYIHHYVYIYIIIYMKNTFVYNICIQPVYLYATLSNPLHIYKSKYALNRISTDIWYIYIYTCFFVLCKSIVSFKYVMTLHLLPFGSRNSPQDSATTQEQPITWIVPKERTTRCSFRFYGRRAGSLLCKKKNWPRWMNTPWN